MKKSKIIYAGTDLMCFIIKALPKSEAENKKRKRLTKSLSHAGN